MTILDRFRLQGDVALVTGAGRGIGRAIALALADAGADVVCTARTQAQIDMVAEQIRERGRRAVAIACDVNDESAREEMVTGAIEALGAPSILINNAGGSGPNDPLNTSTAQFSSVLQWNVVPAFDLIRLVAPHMKGERQGRIVNISSAAARYRQPNFSAYGAAKAALSHMTRLLAQDLAPDIRVNAIEPGPILTEALAPYLTPARREAMINSTPMGRLGEVQDVAASAVFLASDASQWITGKVIELDGGVEAPPKW